MKSTIGLAAHRIREGRLTCEELLEHYLGRIDEVEERVCAWVFVDRDRARRDASARDRELKSGYDRGVLHGIPVGIKDIIDVFDWPTSCGSTLWKKSYARHDAPIVSRLRAAGAILVGKTVTTQYASFDPPPTRNPWNLSRTPGGSSSGSAAALAAGMVLATIGSQTGGSITRPASFCGVPACKPTYGLINLQGILPLAPSMDHPGPLATCVEDVAIVLQAIADPGPRDLRQCLSRLTRKPKLGRLRGLFERRADDSVRQMMDRMCATLQQHGAELIEVALPSSFEEVLHHHRVIMAVEAAGYHQDRLRVHPEDYGPNIRALIEEGLGISGPEYLAAREHQRSLKNDMLDVFRDLDALIAPATTRAAPDLATTGDPAFNSPWSFTGLPVVSLPTGLSEERMPLGAQLIGSSFQEESLFKVAHWVEQKLGPLPEDPPIK